MKKIRLILLLMLSLAIVLGSFTSCEMLEEKFPGVFGNETDDTNGDTTGDETPDVKPEDKPDDKPADTVDPSTCKHFVTTIKNKTASTCSEEGYTGDTVCYACGTVIKPGKAIAKVDHKFENGKCSVCGEEAPADVFAEVKAQWMSQYECITIAEANALCKQFTSAPSTDRYYIIGTVKSVDNAAYGQLTIEDETGSIMVYGTYSSDGEKKYSEMGVNLKAGDLVLLHSTLQNYNGTNEVQNGRLIDYAAGQLVPPSINPDDYQLSTIADVRLVADETVVKVSGVVARITYAFGMKPSGFYLVDGTNSIYVYDDTVASSVSVGNTVTVIGEKDHWILEGEVSSAEKFGYKGCNQITKATLVANDNGNSDFDKSWIQESTVKEIMDTPVTEDITTTIFKVNALVKKAVGSNFINYYIDDLDGVTGSYVYTQCSGSDFAWLDQFDGKICTVYLSVINAKSNASNALWRFLPIAVEDNGYTFDVSTAPQFAIDYYAKDQFLSGYTSNPELKLVTSVSSELLGFENVVLSYASSDENVATFNTDADGNVIFNLVAYGNATITVTATHNGNVATHTLTVKYSEATTYDYISVEDAILAADDTTVIVKGIVGPSLVNKVGFYLMGEEGLIAVITTAETMQTLEIGNEVIIQGKRELYINPDKSGRFGQSSIVDVEVLVNNYGKHEYNDDYFITDKTATDVKNLNIMEDHTTEVYVLDLVLTYVDAGYYTTLNVKDANGVELKLYMSGAGQYSWMSEYYGQTVTVELAPCNWNDKTDQYRICILAIILEDGTKIYNTSNWA